MSITYEQIKAVSDGIVTTNIKGKEYVDVAQRIKAFRMNHPNGFIITEMLDNMDGVCVFRAKCGEYDENGIALVLGTGTAYEKETSSYINKTSYIENCETSAVGRALGMAGYGIDTSVASYEEVANARMNQGADADYFDEWPHKEVASFATQSQIAQILKAYAGHDDALQNYMEKMGISELSALPYDEAVKRIDLLKKKGKL